MKLTRVIQSKSKHAALAVSAFVAGVLVAGGLAFAAIPDSSGVIHGCRDTAKGDLRVIDTDAGQTCTAKETALNWQQSGSTGGGSGDLKAYGRIYADANGVFQVDQARSSHITGVTVETVELEPGESYSILCVTADVPIRSISVSRGSTGINAVAFKDANGWANDNAYPNLRCSGDANIAIFGASSSAGSLNIQVF